MAIMGASFSSDPDAGAALIALSPGQAAHLYENGYTVAVLDRFSTSNAGLFSGYDGPIAASPADVGALLISGTSIYGTGDFSSGYGAGLNDSTWRWIVYGKDPGPAHYRMHYADLETLTWSHGESVGAGNHNDGVEVSTLALGFAVYGLGFYNHIIVTAAVWDRHLSDSEIEAACARLSSTLKASGPVAGWSLPCAESATPGTVRDFTGGGADELYRQTVGTYYDPDTDEWAWDDYVFPVHLWMAPDALTGDASGTKFADASNAGITLSTKYQWGASGTITHVRYPGFDDAVNALVRPGIFNEGSSRNRTPGDLQINDPSVSVGNWIDYPLSVPRPVGIGEYDRVALHSVRDGSSASQYFAKSGFWAGGPVTDATGAIIGQQGYFHESDHLEYPNDSFGNSTYFIDVVFRPDVFSFYTYQIPLTEEDDLTIPRQLGMRFSTDAAGSVTGWRYWVPAAGVPTAAYWQLWRVSDQTLLAEVDIAALAPTVVNDWAYGKLDTPIELDPADQYLAMSWTAGTGAGSFVYTDDGSEAFPLVIGPLTVDTGYYQNGQPHTAWPDPPGSGDGPYFAYFFADVEFTLAPEEDDGGEGSASFAITTAVAATGARASQASADLGVHTALAATGARPSEGSANFAISTAVAGSAARPSLGSANFAIQTALAGTGGRTSLGAADFTVHTAVAATGARPSRGSAGFAIHTALSAHGQDPATIPILEPYGAGLSTTYGVGLETDYEVGLTWRRS